MTGIEWTDETWNPTTGCDRVSPGCDNCYALTMARRLKAMGSAKYQRDGDPRTSGPGFGVSAHEDALSVPLGWRKPRKVFVNSTSDLFHERVPDEFIAQVFGVMAVASGGFSGATSPRRSMGKFRMYPGGPELEASLPAADHGPHTFQVLTKRHGRMRSLLNSREFRVKVAGTAYRAAHNRRTAGALADRIEDGPLWPLPNVHLGVSAENQRWAGTRIPALLDTPAAVRFVSAEPLLGSLNIASEWADLDWVIVGGESGPGARPMDLAWVRDLVNDCRALGIAPFVKQLGSVWARANGWGGKGGLPEEWPADIRVREFPQAVAA